MQFIIRIKSNSDSKVFYKRIEITYNDTVGTANYLLGFFKRFADAKNETEIIITKAESLPEYKPEQFNQHFKT
jgi:hypothetical protein